MIPIIPALLSDSCNVTSIIKEDEMIAAKEYENMWGKQNLIEVCDIYQFFIFSDF